MERLIKNFLIVTAAILGSCAVILCCGCNSKYESIYADDGLIASYNSFGDSDYTVDETADGLYVSSSAFSGIETLIFAFTVDSDTSARLHIDHVFSGKVKVVLSDNENVYTLASCGQLSKNLSITGSNASVDFNEIPNGIYSLKIVGVKAEFDMWFSY